MGRLTRRDFICGSGALGLTLSLGRLQLGCREVSKETGTPPDGVLAELPPYGDWTDLYRQRFTWDSVHKSTHHVNCWYQRGCNWNVYVKEGVVFREEQAATYEQTNPQVPDFNPRGCQKGACFSERMYDGSRLQYPLKRVGARGEGRWKRVSWEEGLRDVADRTIDALREHGPASVVWDPGGNATNGCNAVGTHRAGFVLDTPILNVNCEVGDHHPGAMATLGKISFASSGDDLFYSDLILIWGSNPTYTQIPNAHFINEARYHGATVVCIAPDYSASAIHADLWLPVEVGTDAALGLAMAQVIVEEGLYDASFIREQSDLPLLVRNETQRFLRQSDLHRGGAEDVFYFHDAASGKLREAGKRSLALNGIEPALEGRHQVTTLEGNVEVRPVFEWLREQLAGYRPEATEAITGTAAKQVRNLARHIARARAATLITQSSFGKFYHGLEMERAQILVFALCGQFGKKGSGVNGFPAMNLAGTQTAVLSSGSLSPKAGALMLAARMGPDYVATKLRGDTDEMFIYDTIREEYRKGGLVSGALFHMDHGGLDELYGGTRRWDPHLKRPLSAYLEEAAERGWQLRPSQVRPRIFFEVGGNIMRRTRGYDRLRSGLLEGLDLLVTLDWRMSNTALHSDYVFPAAAWYEKDDITWATPIAPFAHPTTRAVPPLGESKSDWEFHCLLLKEVQRRAKERGLSTFTDRSGATRRLDRVYDKFTFGRRYGENDAEKFLRELLSMTTNLGDVGWDELKEKGFARYTGLGMDFVSIGNATDIEPNETITANTWHTDKKLPWPTLTRRMQFYIDHPFYLELGEALPVHKDPPAVGGDLPLRMTGQHARWSIHASWRDTKSLLQLQRGGPVVVMSRSDAQARGLADGEPARVWNELGAFHAQVKISDALRPGQLTVNHGWEPYQFKGWSSHQALIGSPINPITLAGGYVHLQPTPISGEPGTNDRATRVEVERIV
ncbi:MAG: molybdopterin-dependent oxidoreductase [Gemmatimonadota bacterium]|nr:molybdopterin-dependent oxidoreductase [Gemmatimonadota bacterium]